jgi:hypothetical protein
MICPTDKMENIFDDGRTDGITLQGFDKFDFAHKCARSARTKPIEPCAATGLVSVVEPQESRMVARH